MATGERVTGERVVGLDGLLTAYAAVCMGLSVLCAIARPGALELLVVPCMICTTLVVAVMGARRSGLVRCRWQSLWLGLGASGLWLISTLNHWPI